MRERYLCQHSIGPTQTAEAMGHEKDVGSLEAGKLADLQEHERDQVRDEEQSDVRGEHDGRSSAAEEQIAHAWWPKVVSTNRQDKDK